MASKPLILMHPLSETLEKLKEHFAEDEGIEIHEVDDLAEANQVFATVMPAMIITSDPRKCIKWLAMNQKPYKKSSSKCLLLTKKKIPFKAQKRMDKLGIAAVIEEPIAPKTLVYKVSFLLRSLPIKKEGEEVDDFTLKKGDAVKSEEDTDTKLRGKNSQEKKVEKEAKAKKKIGLNLVDDDEAPEKEEESSPEEEVEAKKKKMSLDFQDEEQQVEDVKKSNPEEDEVKKRKKLGLDLEEEVEEDDEEEESNPEEDKLEKKKRLGLQLEDAEPEIEEEESTPEEETAKKKKKMELQLEEIDEPDEDEEESDPKDELEKKKKLGLNLEDIEDQEEEPEEEEEKETDRARKKKMGLTLEELDEPEEEDEEESDPKDDLVKKKKLGLKLEDIEEPEEDEVDEDEEDQGPQKKKKKALKLEDLEEPIEEEESEPEDGKSAKKKALGLALEDEEEEEEPTLEKKKKQLTEEELPEDEEEEEKLATKKKLGINLDDGEEEEEEEEDEEEEESKASKKKLGLPLEDEPDEEEEDEEQVDEEIGLKKKLAKKLEMVEEEEEEKAQAEEEEAKKKKKLAAREEEEKKGKEWEEQEQIVDDNWDIDRDEIKDEKWEKKKRGPKDLGSFEDEKEEQIIHYDHLDDGKKIPDFEGVTRNKKRHAPTTLDYDEIKDKIGGKRRRDSLEAKKFGPKSYDHEDEESGSGPVRDTYFEPETKGVEHIIYVLDIYKKGSHEQQNEDESVYKYLGVNFIDECDGYLVFFTPDYENDESIVETMNSLAFCDEVEYSDQWQDIKDQNFEKWKQTSTPTWKDHTFQSNLNYYIYPFYEGLDFIGFAVAIFFTKIDGLDESRYEAFIESSRAILLENYHVSGQSGKYQGPRKKAEKKKGFFGKVLDSLKKAS
ncbi:MAG: hypothetical protein HOE90_07705 [Bacteriovoracaceae bacterium]|jgi:hypothetical protein|nr:hypothetical protein [Bacteriovoracaceae bacterium]